MHRPTMFAGLAMLIIGTAAIAHPKLVSATPAPNTAVAAPGRVELRFSERLMPKFCGADLVMTAANRAPIKVASTVGVAADGRTLVVSPRSRLGAGRYSIAWRVVSVDTHRVAGNYAFAVK